MSIKRGFLSSHLLLSLVFFVPLFLAACNSYGPHSVVFWTSITDDIDFKAQQHIVAAFEKANPDLHVNLVRAPSTGTGDATSLITSARGGVGPDVFLIDRFTVAQQASIGLLNDLSSYASKESGLDKQYLPFAWQEATYQGHPYGLPMDTDARALYYNKKMLRDAGVNPDVLNPSHGPPSLQLVEQIADKVNHLDNHGAYDRLGFDPSNDQGFFSTWQLDFGAKFYNQQSCQLTPTEAAQQQAYQFMYDWSKHLGPQKQSTFWATYEPANMLPSQNPLFINRFALDISGDWQLANIKEYAPKLDYGVTYLPIPQGRKTPFTWSGGFSLVMPAGVHNPDGAWRFMRFMAGPDGQRIYTKESSHMPTWAPLLNEKSLYTPDHLFFVNLLRYSVSRPPLPIGLQLNDEYSAAQQAVTLNTDKPQSVLQRISHRLQPMLDQYCPVKLNGWSPYPVGSSS